MVVICKRSRDLPSIACNFRVGVLITVRWISHRETGMMTSATSNGGSQCTRSTEQGGKKDYNNGYREIPAILGEDVPEVTR